jgi:hypothetical protein
VGAHPPECGGATRGATVATSTVSANAVALAVSKRGVKCDAKRVRSWARANMARFNKATHEDYTTHAYTPAEAKRIADALVSRARGSVKPGTPSRASSAARGRGAAKPTSAPKRARGTGSVPPTAPTTAPSAPKPEAGAS